MKFRKKPVVIDAIIWNGDNIEEVERWTNKVAHWSSERNKVLIDTLEGPMEASVGDYIIRGVQGEYYACKPDIFAETYDVAYSSYTMDFGNALNMMKDGTRMHRSSWGHPYCVTVALKENIARWGNTDYYLRIEFPDGKSSLYIPTNDDILADDWRVFTKD